MLQDDVIVMPKKKILFVTHKIFPYLPVDEETLGKELPQKLSSRGFEIRTFMPKFGAINERRNQLHEVIRLSGMNIVINNTDHPLVLKVASLQPARIQVYFIDNDDYFIKSPDDEDVLGSNRQDNDERAIFFARGTAETVKKLRWEPEIVHVSGWITSLLPFYLRKIYGKDPIYYRTKIIYSVLPGEITGGLDKDFFNKLLEEGFKDEELKPYAELPLNTNLLHRLAIDHSDAVIFHEENPDEEILSFARNAKVPVLLHSDLDSDGKIISDFYTKLIDEKE